MNVNIKKEDKILIVAPHPDDESIGCGGLMSIYGNQCDILLLTDGRKGHTTDKYNDENKLVEIRKQEITKAADIAHVRKIYFLNIPDGTVSMNENLVTGFDIKKYTYIFIPNRYESHPDHKVCYKIFKSMKFRQQAKSKLYEYEVWTPLIHPTWFLDISSVIETKKRLIDCHVSQLADIDYCTKGIALSCYRGMFNNTKYSEAYTYSEYSGIKKTIYKILPKKFKNIIKSKMN